MNFAVFQQTPSDPALLADIVKDKVVYELGAGDGIFARELAKYAKKVVAVEMDVLYAQECRMRGLETIQEDLMDIDLKEAEVIYCFLSFCGLYSVARKLRLEDWHGTLISCYYPLHEVPGQFFEPDQIIHDQLPFLIYNL